MRILIVTGDYPSHNSMASIFTHSQAKALQNRGIDVRVLVVDMRSIRRLRKWGYKKDEFDGITVYRMAVPCGPIPRLLDLLSPVAGECAFKRILKDWGMPDIIHTHFSATSLPAVRIKERYRVPMVLTEHGSGFVARTASDREKMIFKSTADSATSIIAVGMKLKQELNNLTLKPIEIIPNVIPPYFFNSQAGTHQEFTFISVGYLIDRKRFDLTIKAFAHLVEGGYNVSLVIVGNGTNKDQLEDIADKLGVSHKVNFVGQVRNSDLPKLYKHSNCFVLPSMSETFGVVYAEAIACGIPVIATRCGGPEDIVNDNNGVLIATDSEDELYDAMKLMVEQAGSYDSQLMSDDIKNRFGEDAIAGRLIDVYNRVLGHQ